MSKAKHIFRKAELTRACRAVSDAGLGVSKVKITLQGEIEIETGPPTAPAGNANDDEWKVA